MQIIIKLILTFSLIAASSFATLYAQAIYVSSNGNDDNSGSISSPLRTLEKALEMVIARPSKEINLREGVYFFKEPTIIRRHHSGNKDAPFIIRAYQNEKVTFTSSVEIPNFLFKKVINPSQLKRLPVNSHGQVYVADLSRKDFFNDLPEGQYGSVSWNGYNLPVAQWPNKGFGYIQSVADKGPFTRLLAPGENPPPFSFDSPSGARFTMKDNCSMDLNLLYADLQDSKDIAVEGYFHNDWFYDRNLLARVNNSTMEMQLLKHTRYGVEDKHGFPRRFKLLHAISQLDMPGEWYFDKKRRLFFIWPVQPINNGSPIMQISNITLIQGDNLKHVRFEKINFSSFGSHGIQIKDSEYISIVGCSFSSSINGQGVRLSGSMNSTIHACNFFDLFKAFSISGRNENMMNLIQEHNIATNNHIYNCEIRGYGLAGIGGIGGYFANNLIHDVNGGLLFRGNDHIIEYNEIYNSGFGMGDWNSIYFGGNLSYFGNEVRYNFFHHFPETPGAHPVTAVRGDDGCSGLSMNNNIFYKTGRGGASGSGPDVHVEGNVAMEINFVWTTFQSPYTPISKSEDLDNRITEHEQMQKDIAAGKLSVNEKANYLGRAELVFGNEGWKKNKVWIDKYPNFSKVFDLTNPNSHPWTQSYSTFKNNYVYKGKSPYIYSHGHNPNKTMDDIIKSMPNTAELEPAVSIDLNIAFEDASALDFRFKDSFTSIDGFEKWDFSKVGLTTDDYRKTPPNKSNYRKKVKTKYEGRRSAGGTLDLAEINLRYPDFAFIEDLTTSKNIIPGVVEAESYDEGCNGITFHDKDNINDGGHYRFNGVDIKKTDSLNSQYQVTSIETGEWMDYTVYVRYEGEYKLTAKVNSMSSNGAFSVSFDNNDKTGVISIDSSSSPDKWAIIEKKILLEKGQHKMRFYAGKGDLNLDWITFEAENVVLKSDITEEMESAINAYPNPTKGLVTLALPVPQQEVNIEIYNCHSHQISEHTYIVDNGKVQLDLRDKPNGVYIFKIQLESPAFIKIIKE